MRKGGREEMRKGREEGREEGRKGGREKPIEEYTLNDK